MSVANPITEPIGSISTLELETLPKYKEHHSKTAFTRIDSKGGAAIDCWEAKKGEIGGIPALDEVFIVIFGSATITMDNTGETFDVGPGSIVRLGQGEPNTWTVHEDLRKVSFFEPE